MERRKKAREGRGCRVKWGSGVWDAWLFTAWEQETGEPCWMRQASKGLAAGTWAALCEDTSILVIPGHAGSCWHPHRLPRHPAVVGADPKPTVDSRKGMSEPIPQPHYISLGSNLKYPGAAFLLQTKLTSLRLANIPSISLKTSGVL